LARHTVATRRRSAIAGSESIREGAGLRPVQPPEKWPPQQLTRVQLLHPLSRVYEPGASITGPYQWKRRPKPPFSCASSHMRCSSGSSRARSSGELFGETTFEDALMTQARPNW